MVYSWKRGTLWHALIGVCLSYTLICSAIRSHAPADLVLNLKRCRPFVLVRQQDPRPRCMAHFGHFSARADCISALAFLSFCPAFSQRPKCTRRRVNGTRVPLCEKVDGKFVAERYIGLVFERRIDYSSGVSSEEQEESKAEIAIFSLFPV